MVPLYAARVQNLETGDYVVIKCGACGHMVEIPPSGLLRGLGLKPTEKVLDNALLWMIACGRREVRPFSEKEITLLDWEKTMLCI